jgi:hypothetical protein
MLEQVRISCAWATAMTAATNIATTSIADLMTQAAEL